MKIYFTDELSEDIEDTTVIKENKKRVKEYTKLIKKIFHSIKDRHTMNVIFVSKDRIQQINRDYRKIDKVTDVISFALMDNDECMYEAEDELGDIFICVDRAIEQAKEYGHSIAREVGFLSVHGYLHLSGYDHMTPEDEKVMFQKQDEILEKAHLRRETKEC